jgi:hypothetical protein
MVSSLTRSTMGEESFYGRASQSFHNEAKEDDEGAAPPPPNESMSVLNNTNRSLVGHSNESDNQPVMDNNDITMMNSTNENNMNNNTNATMMPCIDMFGDVNGGSPWFDISGDTYNCAWYASYNSCARYGNFLANCGTDEDEDGTLDWTLGDGS